VTSAADAAVKPRRLRLEATSVCQLHCPDCPTATGDARPVVGTGHLRFDHFRKLLDENPQLVHVELSNYGELFLNPNLPKIIEYAFSRGVMLTADNGTNLNYISEEALDAVVKYRFRSVNCSIDGATAETYAKYRVGGNFDGVIANIRKIQELKRVHRSRYPRLRWQFIAFPHNQHEIEAARKLAKSLGMKFNLKLPWKDHTENPANNSPLAQIATRAQYRERYGVELMRPICRQLWNLPQVNWDGRVLGCCRNFWGEFGGNAFVDGLQAVVNSDRMRYARGMLRGQNPAKADIPCSTCDLYLSMQRSARWITDAEIKIPTPLLDRIYRAGLANKFVLGAIAAVCRIAEMVYFRYRRIIR
jgi:hypothetical protein